MTKASNGGSDVAVIAKTPELSTVITKRFPPGDCRTTFPLTGYVQVPLAAYVITPLELTVRKVLVYEPGVTAVAGKSLLLKALNVGVPDEPSGEEKTRFCDWETNEAVSVPEPVTGEPETLNIPGSDKPTLVTPEAAGVAHSSGTVTGSVPDTVPARSI